MINEKEYVEYNINQIYVLGIQDIILKLEYIKRVSIFCFYNIYLNNILIERIKIKPDMWHKEKYWELLPHASGIEWKLNKELFFRKYYDK